MRAREGDRIGWLPSTCDPTPLGLCRRALLFDSVQQTAFAGGIRSFVTGVSAETGHDCAHMMLGGLGGNKQFFGDLSIGQSLGQERKNF
jgi:hypothetical protein